MTDVYANCRICRKVIAVSTGRTGMDTDPNFPRRQAVWLEKMMASMAEKWKGALTCNRCYDFRRNFRAAEDQVAKRCAALFNKTGDQTIRADIEHAAQRICQIIGDHYFLEGLYHEDFLDMLMSEPRNSGLYIRGVHANARRLSKEAKRIAA